MHFLIAVSFLWAFSFGLIGSKLSGLDSSFIASVRLCLALLCFVPFFRAKRISFLDMITLTAIGALQFGVMYICYMRSYHFLPSHLVALFSIFTPLYIVLAHSLMQKTWHWAALGCALLSIAGAVVIRYTHPSGSFWNGFALMQISNIAFGVGQLLYRSWKKKHTRVRDSEVIAALYLGGAITAGIGFLAFGDSERITPTSSQWYAILYLGAISSGIGFFLWNKGAAIAKPGILAASNNALIPLAMVVSLFYFGEAEEITSDAVLRLTVGAIFIFSAMAWGQKAIKA